jgi:hypothetical protein
MWYWFFKFFSAENWWNSPKKGKSNHRPLGSILHSIFCQFLQPTILSIVD